MKIIPTEEEYHDLLEQNAHTRAFSESTLPKPAHRFSGVEGLPLTLRPFQSSVFGLSRNFILFNQFTTIHIAFLASEFTLESCTAPAQSKVAA